MPLDRAALHARIEAPEMLDYGVYLSCDKLLSCQKPLAKMANADELQFQIVHQVEELWMKLIAYTLVEIDGHLTRRETFRVLTLFDRVNRLMRLMTQQLDILETMSPHDYQAIRLQLGNGSGQESPGFRLLLELPQPIWKSFETTYLAVDGRSVADIYDAQYRHDEAYMVAEALVEYDELFQKFRAHHIYLIHRSIGMGAQSLKGRSVELLNAGTRHRFFPELWDIRWQMTDRWGGEYGRKRPSISGQSEDEGEGENRDAAGHGGL